MPVDKGKIRSLIKCKTGGYIFHSIRPLIPAQWSTYYNNKINVLEYHKKVDDCIGIGGRLKTESVVGQLRIMQSRTLDEMVNDAESRKVSYISFLNSVFSEEISWRAKRRFEHDNGTWQAPIFP